MNFEAQNTNNEKEQKEDLFSKKTSEFKEFLSDQISLPSEKWDKKFIDYIEEKRQIEEITEKEDYEDLPSGEKTYKRYLKMLDLNEADLKNKRILDLGCGEEGEFVKECINKDITKDIYGLDFEIKPDIFDENLKNNFFQGVFEEGPPVKDLDYVLSVGAVQAPTEELDPTDLVKILSYNIDAISDSGEIRITPIRKAPVQNELPGIEDSREKWAEALNRMADDKNIEYEFKPIDIVASNHNKDVWLDEVLIIKKKKNIN